MGVSPVSPPRGESRNLMTRGINLRRRVGRDEMRMGSERGFYWYLASLYMTLSFRDLGRWFQEMFLFGPCIGR